jgi:hypothetical protein
VVAPVFEALNERGPLKVRHSGYTPLASASKRNGPSAGRAEAVAVLRNQNNPIECRFPADQSRVLGRYNSGEVLKVRGKISSNQNGQQLYILYCEVVS